ncbi:MAG: regulatory protein RecX [Deltaproteobacteria bacterium]|nr:regulatory protein RecX [Deltaproteobacteria bacterium]TLN03953.1 MAG: regulatory protein RecX [bacterium]
MPEARTPLALALNLLSRRDHSEAELRKKLFPKGFTAEALDETMARLKSAGYLDDRRFARSFAESALRNGRGYGFRLRLEMSRRGIAAEIIEETLAALGDEYEEITTLSELMARKFEGFDPQQADERQKRRVISYFQRRGFSLAAIVRVIRDRGE